MEKIFLRIFFLVFPLIFFDLVEFSIHSNLVENNQTWDINEKKYVIKTNNIISKNNTSNNLSGDGILHLKLKGRILDDSNTQQQNMKTFIDEYYKKLKDSKDILNDRKTKLDKCQSSLGDFFSHLVCVGEQCQKCSNVKCSRGEDCKYCVTCTQTECKNKKNCDECKDCYKLLCSLRPRQTNSKDINEDDYEQRLNGLFYYYLNFCRRDILEARNTILDLYTIALDNYKILSNLITNNRKFTNDSRNDYNKLMKLLREVLDLIFHNASKCNNVNGYLKFLSHQVLMDNNKRVHLAPPASGIQTLSVGETSVLDKIFNVKVISFGALSVLLISGIVIYYFVQKKQ